MRRQKRAATGPSATPLTLASSRLSALPLAKRPHRVIAKFIRLPRRSTTKSTSPSRRRIASSNRSMKSLASTASADSDRAASSIDPRPALAASRLMAKLAAMPRQQSAKRSILSTSARYKAGGRRHPVARQVRNVLRGNNSRHHRREESETTKVLRLGRRPRRRPHLLQPRHRLHKAGHRRALPHAWKRNQIKRVQLQQPSNAQRRRSSRIKSTSGSGLERDRKGLQSECA